MNVRRTGFSRRFHGLRAAACAGALLAAGLAPLPLRAAVVDYAWSPSPASSDWFDPANWAISPPQPTPPDTGSIVTIDNGQPFPRITAPGALAHEIAIGFVLGPAQLDITNGGTLHVELESMIGDMNRSLGEVNVSGGGSRWDTAHLIMALMKDTEGTLNISDGATVNSSVAEIADPLFDNVDGFHRAYVTVDDATWSISDDLILGSLVADSVVSMTVSNGGGVSSQAGYVRSSDISYQPAVATVTGSGSAWNLTGGDLYLSSKGVGTNLSILDHAAVNVKGGAGNVHLQGSGGNTLTIGDGAALNAASVTGEGSAYDEVIFDIGSGSTNFSPALSGRLNVTKSGDGIAILTGSATYTGATTIESGHLQFGAGGTNVSLGTGDILDNASLGISAANDITYAGNITGAGRLIVTGGGTLTLTGANTYAGSTLIGNGSIVEFAAGSLGSGGANSITLAGGGLRWASGNTTDISGRLAPFTDSVTFDTGGNTVQFTHAISGAGSVTKAGAGTLVLSAAATYDGATTISSGTLQLGNGASLGSGNIVDNASLLVWRTESLTLSNNISGSGALTKQDAGALTLTGANTYSGATTLTGGTLAAGSSGALSPNSAFVVNGGTLALGSYNSTLAGLTGTGGAVTFSGGTLTINQSANTTYAGALTGTGGGGFTKLGAGTLTLSGASNSLNGQTRANGGTLALAGALTSAGVHVGENGYTGALVVTGTLNAGGFLTVGDNTGSGSGGAGTLTIGSGGLVTLYNSAKLTVGWTNATGTLNLNSGGTLEIGGSNGIQKASSGTAHVNFSGGTLKVVNSALTTSLPIALTGVSTIDTNNLAATLSGALTGSGGLTKTGAGTLTLAAANTTTGLTTISAGTLRLGAGGSLTASSLAVAPGATFDAGGAPFTLGAGRTLSGGGTILGDITLGGALAPDGQLTFGGSLTLGETSTITIDIAGADSFDRISVAGALAYGGTLNLAFSDGFDIEDGESYTFQLFKNFDSQSGAFSAFGYSDPAHTVSFDYATGTLAIAAVPEPATWALGALVLLAWLIVRRRGRAARSA